MKNEQGLLFCGVYLPRSKALSVISASSQYGAGQEGTVLGSGGHSMGEVRRAQYGEVRRAQYGDEVLGSC